MLSCLRFDISNPSKIYYLPPLKILCYLFYLFYLSPIFRHMLWYRYSFTYAVYRCVIRPIGARGFGGTLNYLYDTTLSYCRVYQSDFPLSKWALGMIFERFLNLV
jgi:hypothetical protein